MLYCDSVLKVGDEVCDKSPALLCNPHSHPHHATPASPPQYERGEEEKKKPNLPTNPHAIFSLLHPHVPVPSLRSRPDIVVFEAGC